MAKSQVIPTKLTTEQMELINSDTLVLISTLDKETGTPSISAISWVKAFREDKVRFCVTNNSRIVTNIKENPRITLCMIGLETVYSIVGTCNILAEKMADVTMPLTKIEVQISGIYNSMFWGAKITQPPKFEKTYDPVKAKALDEQVYASLLN
jgi:uncharacterized pyridoxamine 5'-phosphate oxidase family protein